MPAGPPDRPETSWPDRARAWRERIRARPHSHRIYQVVVAVVGGTLTIGGLALVPLPGPGWAIVILGLYVLASEFAWAERIRDLVVDRVKAWTRWLGRQSVAVRLAVGLATFLCVAGALWAVFALQGGAPGWVPANVVPPLPGL